MPQVFGAEELALVKEASLWVESGFLEDVDEHEKALSGAGFDNESLPVNLNRTGFHPRGDVWGKHLGSDKTHHRWAVVRVANPDVNPNDRQPDVGGPTPRYAAEIHTVPRDPAKKAGVVIPVWTGNRPEPFLSKFESALRKGPGAK